MPICEKISIVVLTYNHERVISKCLNSILNQETQYDFKIIIADDYSTDNTRLILEEFANNYPQRIELILNNANMGLVSNYYNALNFCKGEYISECAGDDVWIDNNKLEKQTKFLEMNEDYHLIHSDADYYYDDDNRIVKSFNQTNNITFNNIKDPLIAKLQGKYKILPLTVMMRRSTLMNILSSIDFEYKKYLMEDTPLWLGFLMKGKIFYMEESTAQYTISNKSISNTNNFNKRIELRKSQYKLYEDFARINNVDSLTKKIIHRNANRNILKLAYHAKNFKEAKRALHNLIKYVGVIEFNPKNLVLLLGSTLKRVNI